MSAGKSQMKAKEATSAPRKLPSQDERPLTGVAAGARRRVERRLAAALGLDIVGYSLMIGNDDEGTHHRVGKALARVYRQICRFEGNVVSFSGDGLMAVFASSRAALGCGIGIQRGLRQGNMKVEPQQRIIFRVGIHAGELVFQGPRVGGDPLNIAARLEQICQPGEVCISAAVLEQVGQMRGISLESIGAQNLKNIRQPVQAYRVTLAQSVQASALDTTMIAQSGAKEVWGGQPSIAVLPLGYVGGGAGDAYFAEDIVEGIVASLIDSNELIVVSRSSKVTHAGRPLDMREVGHTLGVRYVLSGSVRRSTTTVRVAAELCDAEDGLTIWADTTEVLLGERFDWQDRIAQRIAAGAASHIHDEEIRHALCWRPNKPAADDLTLDAPPRRIDQSRRLDVVDRGFRITPFEASR
jgi:adenylate cyclase